MRISPKRPDFSIARDIRFLVSAHCAVTVKEGLKAGFDQNFAFPGHFFHFILEKVFDVDQRLFHTRQTAKILYQAAAQSLSFFRKTFVK
jgi:hypothetical protein